MRFVTTAAGRARLTVVRRGKTLAVMAKNVPAGAGSITWNGNAGGRKAKPGSYRLILSVAGSGRRATAESALRLR